MVAHIELPALDETQGTGDVQPEVVTGLLREQLKFNGLVFTDSMQMEGVTKMGTPAKTRSRPCRRGIDVLLDFGDTWARVSRAEGRRGIRRADS